jgi:peptide/nickel transport system ATP-binding protein
LVLELKDVSKAFVVARDWLGRPVRRVRALSDVSLNVAQGRSVGLVGESGSGKTTLARIAAGLEVATTGSLKLSGVPYPEKALERRRFVADKIGMVFQDPKSSLNPRRTVQELIAAPLSRSKATTQKERQRRVLEVLELVELELALLSRYPHELSGGQAQRVALARALAAGPQLLLLDEAVSSLDVTLQARILRLLDRLRRKLDLSYLFIGHDLGVVEVLCDEVAVMYLGSIVEQGPASTVLETPKHPYTRTLLSAVPSIGKKLKRLDELGEPASALDPPGGCAYHTRCFRAEARCRCERPRLSCKLVDHPTACFFADDSEPRVTG